MLPFANKPTFESQAQLCGFRGNLRWRENPWFRLPGSSSKSSAEPLPSPAGQGSGPLPGYLLSGPDGCGGGGKLGSAGALLGRLICARVGGDSGTLWKGGGAEVRGLGGLRHEGQGKYDEAKLWEGSDHGTRWEKEPARGREGIKEGLIGMGEAREAARHPASRRRRAPHSPPQAGSARVGGGRTTGGSDPDGKEGGTTPHAAHPSLRLNPRLAFPHARRALRRPLTPFGTAVAPSPAESVQTRTVIAGPGPSGPDSLWRSCGDRSRTWLAG